MASRPRQRAPLRHSPLPLSAFPLLVLVLLLPVGPALGGPECDGNKCPDVSECTSLDGAPICQCPENLYSRLIKNKCTAAPLRRWGWLDLQNSARAAVGVEELLWDAGLAASAQTWANTLAAEGCASRRGGTGPGVGQNTAKRIDDLLFKNSDAVGLWVGQGGVYQYSPFSRRGAGSCTTGKWRDCSAYSQVVWANTKKVGCAVGRCNNPNGKVYVCNYSPGGNVVGQFPFKK